MNLLIKRAKPLQFHPPAAGAETDLYIEDGVIRAMGPGLKKTAEKTIDAAGKWIMPGNVCAHNHFYSALARGIIADIPPSYDFVGVLQHLWWRLDRALDEASLYSSGLVGALEAIKAGTTAVIDHNASPSFILGSSKALKKAFQQCGLRGILCYEVTDRNGRKDRDQGVEENVSFIRSEETDTIRGAVGAHASFTVDDESLRALAEAVKQTRRGIHIHVAEDAYDISHAHHQYGKTPIERLADAGMLDEKSLIIHGVHILEKDVELLNRHHSFLVHNPKSNMNNAVGHCRRLRGLNHVALGTDGIGSDMFEEAKFGYFKANDAGAGLGPADLMRFLAGGNELLELYFGNHFGRVQEGYAADLVILDYPNPTPLQEGNTAGHLLFGMSQGAVETVIVNGACVYENRRFPFDVQPIYEEARRQAARLWKEVNRF